MSNATVTKDPSRSSDQWEQRADGKWYRREYYKVEEEEPLRVIEIWDRLFIGAVEAAHDEQFLRKQSITRILVLGADLTVQQRPGIQIRQLPVDGETIQEFFNPAIEFIREGLQAGESVLVVCRTMLLFCPIIIIVYFVAILNFTLEAAIERIQTKLNITLTRFQIHQLTIWWRSIQAPPPVVEEQRERKRNIRVYSAPIPQTAATTNVTTTNIAAPIITPAPVIAPAPVYTYNTSYYVHPPAVTTGYSAYNYYGGAYAAPLLSAPVSTPTGYTGYTGGLAGIYTSSTPLRPAAYGQPAGFGYGAGYGAAGFGKYYKF